MSAIVSFTLLRKSALEDLRNAAVPRRGFLGAKTDRFHPYLEQHGREVVEYPYSGYLFGTLLVYLKKRGIDLMTSEFDELSTYICKERQVTCFFFTSEHRDLHYKELSSASFSEEELCNYYNKFNAAHETGVGQPLIEGIDAIKQSLSQLDSESVIVFIVG